ncbi:Protein FAM218A [Frankliniella fusca]|uniref:Protein FAM218A n=1 Tax=Frankliniella fusca TaxID=407009 RepID=A0AAE1HDE4_9NEOP|nr:Protein FAM218A [Frankliniella fusca]KAK3919224.1 Protein FAM218A [Frankliniella fusca]
MIICKIIDNALARDFLLKKNDDPGENFFVLTVNTPMEGTILCKIGECKKRTHTIAISRSKTRAWSVYNFYRHIRSSHLSEEAEKSQKRTKRQRKLDFSNIEKSKESIESSQEFLSDNPDSPPSLIDDHNEDSGNQEENDSTSIWQLPKYQRSERNKRGLETAAQSSHTITEYWPVLNKIEAAIKENESLHTTVRLLLAKLSEVPESPPTISNFLMCLNDSAAKNANKKKGGERYTDELSLIATHFFMLAGPKAYSDLYGNLPKVIPCPSTVENVMKRNKSILVEGEFRWKALSEFLEERGYPREVVMQEDATKCIGCVQYDPSSNQMIGFVPDLDNRGLPEILKFPATSEDVMRGYFESKETSQYVYCILARPLKDFASSFVVSCFGTNNKFKADHVKARWPYELQAAAAHNIQIKVFSSDGDTRCLSTMRELMFQACGNPLSWHFWFRATLDLKVVCVQDPTHVATKLRNLLLRSKILCVGDYYISVNHIRFMMENTSKDQHKLADEDINPKDRMNFKSAEKLFSKTVTTLMQLSKSESKGTCVFLDMANAVTEAFLDRKLEPLDRIEMLWKATFFYRGWRQWVSSHPFYTLKDNFLTSNTYLCIEINAHALLILVRYYRDHSGEPDVGEFCPWLWSSQGCESLFRAVRSMTTTFCTVMNFTVREFLQKVSRATLEEDIKNRLGSKFFFSKSRREGKTRDGVSSTWHFPSDQEILKVIEATRNVAQVSLNRLGVDSDIPNVFSSLPEVEPESSEDEDEDRDRHPDRNLRADTNNEPCGEPSSEPDEPGTGENLTETSTSLFSGKVQLRTYPDAVVTPNGPFVKVRDRYGERATVKKSGLTWMLNKRTKGSNDRLVRYQKSEGKGKQRQFSGNLAPTTAPKGVKKQARGVGVTCDMYKVLEHGELAKRLEYSSGTSGEDSAAGILYRLVYVFW